MLDDFRLIQPRCTVVWCIPFWSRKTSSYINPISRIRILQSVAEKLNKTILTGASDWRVCLNEDETEPYRVSKRHPGKLVADIVPCDAFLEEVRGILRRRGLIGIVKVEISSSVIHLNDYGLGCIEYSFEFSTFNVSNDDIDNWYSILLKSEFWRDFDALGNSYADGQLLPIHTSWSTLRIAIGEVFREQEIDFGELDEFVDQNSDHDLAWTRGCNIILYKSNDQAPPDLLDYRKKLTEITSCISNAYNQNITGTVTQRFYDTDFGSLDVYAAGFGFVALATTVGADGQESDFIPKKLRAMWRSFHINYAALTTASDRMQYISETSLKKTMKALA